METNGLQAGVVRFHAETGFFAGETTPLQARESTGGATFLIGHCSASFLIGHYDVT